MAKATKKAAVKKAAPKKAAKPKGSTNPKPKPKAEPLQPNYGGE